MMKTMKSVYLTSLLLLAAISATAQEDYYDDVYFSTKSKKRERTDERRMSASDRPASRQRYDRDRDNFDSDRDVDAYNRRYTDSSTADYNDYDRDARDDNRKAKASERRGDHEYSERIIRYHSPSKITITGADNVDLNLSDGYYSYSYDTDYSGGRTNVNIKVTVDNGWDAWYSW